MIYCDNCKEPLRRPNMRGTNAEKHFCKRQVCVNAYHKWLRDKKKDNK